MMAVRVGLVLFDQKKGKEMTENLIPGEEMIRDYLDDVERLVKMTDLTNSPEMKQLLHKAVHMVLFEKLYPRQFVDFMPTPNIR